MEIRQYTAILWRWKWLLAVCALLAAIAAFVVSSLATPIFEASTMLYINQAPDSRSSDYSAILASERLARTYTEMLTNRPVLEEALSRVELSIAPKDLEDAMDVRLLPDTQLIELKIESPDPLLAAVLANSIVEVFAEEIDTLQTSRFAASKASLSARLDRISAQIAANEAAIDDMGNQQTDTQNAETERLQTELAQYQASHTNLFQSYEELRFEEARSISNVIQVEPAEQPERPIRPRILLNTSVASVVGIMIAVGTVFLIEYLDDTLKSEADVVRTTQLPVIGYVENSKKLAKSKLREKLMISEPNSPLAESFRLVRTNIELAGTQGTPRSILVASPSPGDGKTTVAAQLAVSMAQGGRKVLLLDANLRQPSLHKYFRIENKLGLADMLVDDLVPQVVAQELIHWRLKIITSGKAVDNPAELMGSITLIKMLAQLREQADVAIFDGPPFQVAESHILASRLESVLMVIRYGHTREEVATHVVQQLSRAKANLIGVAMNRVPVQMAHDLSSNLAYGFDDRWSGVSNSRIDQPSQVKRPVVLRKETGS